MENLEGKFAVLDRKEYYQGSFKQDEFSLVDIFDDIDSAKEKEDELNSEPYCLEHGQSSGYYIVAKIDGYDISFQTWLDGVDWDGCPVSDTKTEDDNQKNIDWATEKSFDTGEYIYLPNPIDIRGERYRDMIVDLNI